MRTSHKAKDESIVEAGWIKPSFLQECSRAGRELRDLWLSSRVTPQESKQPENPVGNTEPSPHEEFLFCVGKSKASTLL